jgi:two-component system alkaline phosphatase synthesis response regulator PhoP
LNAVSPPCLVLSHPDAVYQAAVARTFRRLGWDVYIARNGPEARRLVRMLEADVVILGAGLPEESGWLTCDKMTREQPLAKVILVSDDLSPGDRELAAFVGASAVVAHSEGLEPLLEELVGLAVPAAG